MEVVHSNMKHLPAEVLQMILQLAVDDIQSRVDPSHCARVCKAWYHPAQMALYSNVTIDNLTQLINFCNTIQHNSYLGNMVKVLKLDDERIGDIYDDDVREATAAETSFLLTNVLSDRLPNLEEINDNTLESYTPVLNALQSSGLKHLKKINSPTWDYTEAELNNYATCALLLKDQIVHLSISDEYDFVPRGSNRDLKFNHLYEKIDQFSALEEIDIKRKASDYMLMMEHIVNCCKFLKNAAFDLRIPESDINPISTSTTTEISSILNCIPASNVKSLDVSLDGPIDDKNFLLYLINKFDKLNNLTLCTSRGNFEGLDHEFIIKLLHYFSKIKKIHILGLKADPIVSAKAIGDYLKSTTATANKKVIFMYTEFNPRESLPSIHFSKSKVEESITLHYPITYTEWMHTNFLEINGNYIQNLHFFFLKGRSRCEVPEDLMIHIFAYCPHIQYLTLNQCSLRRLRSSPTIDNLKTFSIQELYITSCDLFPGVLEPVSKVLNHVKQLSLNNITYCIEEDNSLEKDDTIEITMSLTNIDVIDFGGNFTDETLLLKVFSAASNSHYYYTYNPSNSKHVCDSNEEEYTDSNNNKHVYISCQNKPDLRF